MSQKSCGCPRSLFCDVCLAEALAAQERHDDELTAAVEQGLEDLLELATERYRDDDYALRWIQRLVDRRLREISPPSNRTKARISREVRWKVWKHDDFRCKHCGSRDALSVDHVYPESRGGSSDLDNLQTLCMPCNSRKGARVE